MGYTPVLFEAIAREVVKSSGEQYLYCSPEGVLSVSIPAQSLVEAINTASLQLPDGNGFDVIRAEYHTGPVIGSSLLMHDQACNGMINMDGVLVEFLYRPLKNGAKRVVFIEVDAMRMHRDIMSRLQKLENEVKELKSRNEKEG